MSFRCGLFAALLLAPGPGSPPTAAAAGDGLVVVPAPAYPAAWLRAVGEVAPTTLVSFTVVLAGQRHDELLAAARAVSDPAGPRYGRHLSQLEIDELTAPAPEAVAAVHAWLDGVAGVSRRRASATDVEVSATAAAASRLLATSFHAVRRGADGARLIRAADYGLPGVVRASVAAIFGLHGLPLPAVPTTTRPRQPPGPGPVSAKTTPSVIRAAYGVPAGTRGHNRTRQAVAEFQGQFMNQTDLKVQNRPSNAPALKLAACACPHRQDTIEKVHLLGGRSHYLPLLQEHMNDKDIPSDYGGSCTLCRERHGASCIESLGKVQFTDFLMEHYGADDDAK